MKTIPQTRYQWGRFLLLPFKAYIVVAYFMATMFSRDLRTSETVLWMLLGYVISFLVLFIVAIVQWILGKGAEAITSIVFAALALLLGAQLLQLLAR